MRTLIPAAVRSYAKPDTTWLPLLFVVLATPVAIAGWNFACLALLAASSIASVITRRRISPLRTLLESGGLFDTALRAIRLAVLLLLGASIWLAPGIAIAVACGGIIITVLSAFTEITVDRLAKRLIPEIFTRNLAVDLTPPPLPARLLAEGLPLLIPELVLLTAGSILTESTALAWVGAILALLTLAVGTLGTDWILRTRGNAFRNRVLGDVQRAIKKLQPEVALYLGAGQASTIYQIDSWLATAEGITETTVVIVRSTETFEVLGKTSLPVIALPTAKDLLALDLSALRACLFVANTGDLIHLIREQNPMSAFIGHGDSDKNSSFNPFTKVYDEVWVAGAAGEDRYAKAHIGVRPEQFVRVGRPQLEAIDLAALNPTGPDNIPTILYAPTWEGWNKEQQYCSLLSQGVQVVEQILRHQPAIRLIFKPHPFTGIRDSAALAAANQIDAMIRKANSARGITSPPTPARKEINTRSAREANARATSVGREYFQSLDPRANIVIQPSDGLGLFQCFEHSDALITDVSSVLSDFMVTDRPYAVCNPRADSDADFIHEFPSAAGSYILDKSGTNAGGFLAVVSGSSPDIRAAERRTTREYLLGPATPSASSQFNQAVSSLIAKANSRIAARD